MDTPTGRRPADLEPSYASLLLDQMSMAVIATDTDLCITAWNRASEELYGWPADQVLGRPLLEIVHPSARRNVEWNIPADLSGEESPITTVEVLRRDGTIVTAQGRGARVTIAGRPAVQVILRDITAIRQMEETVRESTERYRTLVDLSPEAIVVHCGELVLHANAAAARLAGAASPEALVGTALFGFVHPGDRAAVRERIETVQRQRVSVPIGRFRLAVGTTVRSAEAVGGPAWWDGAPAVQVIITRIPEPGPRQAASS